MRARERCGMGRPAITFCEKHSQDKKRIGKGYYCLECKKEKYHEDRRLNPEKFYNAKARLRMPIPDGWTSKTIVNLCKKHGELRLDDVKYINPNNIRCKKCIKEINDRSKEKNRISYNESLKERRENDIEYAEYKRLQSRVHQKKRYLEKRDHMLEISKKWRASNPDLQKNITYKKRYGLTLEEYYKLFDAQEGRCKICNNPESALDNTGKEGKLLSVDHCHQTNLVRGLLCSRCNCMIGYSRDSEEILEAAKLYIREYKHGIQVSCTDESG